ncbi:hypothetical protein [Allorhodopirellula solitaria]|uniref:Uncharacterized protein n=1 Tax=Allorhodopirellula solitaria TaxID=2527987 RepID=A0A5C5XR82_9BACT|nr:hypothetical protein [Allorhodopirellula solitaria]TWT64863.1 hypothetical protein CA85_36480 [Allorhodopirellula solitaria]
MIVPITGHAQNGFSTAPQTNMGPISPPSTGNAYPSNGYSGQTLPPATGSLGPATPQYDPYATSQGSSSTFGPPAYPSSPAATPPPGTNSSYPNGGLLGGIFSGSMFSGQSNVYSGAGYPATSVPPFGGTTSSAAPYNAPPIYGPSTDGSPYYGGGTNGSMPYGSGSTFSTPPPANYGTPTFPPSAYPSGAPTSLFPQGFGDVYSNTMLPVGSGMTAYDLLRGPRFRQTFVTGGNSQDDLGVSQTDVSIGLTCDNFLYSNRPLSIAPSFSLYLFDGPISIPSHQADLPGNAYAGFLDFGWQSDPNQIVGGEFGVRVGAFSDFDTFNEDSIRILGRGLFAFRLTPSSTIKAGLYYLDRESIKMLPAGGVLCQPNPYTRYDIFFPEPKFAKYWRTLGTQDVWWYIAGNYGGGSWTITRANAGQIEERVDINQIEAVFGWEWGRSDLIRMGQRTAFFEIGGVFNRELEYEISPDDQSLSNAFMFRGGFGY